MKEQTGLRILDAGISDTRIKSANVQNSERWLGFFWGPALVACIAAICNLSYLNAFYTDVLKLSPVAGGLFLADCFPVYRKWLAELRLGQKPDRRIGNVAPTNGKGGFFGDMFSGSVDWGDVCVIVPYYGRKLYENRCIH